MVVVSTVRFTGLQRRTIAELFKDAGTPLIDLFLTVTVKGNVFWTLLGWVSKSYIASPF